MTTMTEAARVETREQITVGRAPNAITGTHAVVTAEGYAYGFVVVGKSWYHLCGRCDQYGTFTSFMHVMAGVCFKCGGAGVGRRFEGGEAEVVKWVGQRARARARAAAKRAAAEAAERAEYTAWAAENAELVAALAPYATPVDWEAPGAGRWEATELCWLADRARWQPLTGEQVDEAVEKLTRVKAAEAAAAARKAAQRWAGEVGGKVTVTGKMVVAMPIETRYGWSRLVIVEGTGADAGVTVKWFTSARVDAERGDAVTIVGRVTEHDTYEGTPQTVVTRAKITKAEG